MNTKSIPGAVLGIIGTVFAFIGGSYVAFCATLVGGVASAVGISSGGSYAVLSYILGFGGAIIGLVGGIMDFKKSKVGGFLQAVALVMILALSIVVYFSVWEIIAMVLFLIGAILSFASKKPISSEYEY